MAEEERELRVEDEIFAEITDEAQVEVSEDAALLDQDEAEDEFVQESVDADDLATGFDATISTRPIDVDEDTQGDEVPDAGGEELLTEFEVPGVTNRTVHGDEVELDLGDALATGRTVAKAREAD